MNRTKSEQAFDRLIIERLHLKSKTLDTITKDFAEIRGYTLSRATIHNEIQKLRKLWEKEAVEMISHAKAEAIRLIRRQEEELWEAWDKSKLDGTRQTLTRQTKTNKEKSDEAGSEPSVNRQSAVKISSCGDPAYMRLLLDLQRERAKIMGYDAPTQTVNTHSGPDGGPIPVAAVALTDADQESILERYYQRDMRKKNATAGSTEPTPETAAATTPA